VIEIHPVSSEDWGIVRIHRLRALRDAPEAFVSDYEREAAYDEDTWRRFATTCQWFVATEDAEVIGMAGGLPADVAVVGTREVIGMWVDPSHRRRGTARALLEHLAAWARDLGADTLRIGLDSRNTAARAAYLQFGLRLTGETEPAVGDPTRTIEFMERDLDSNWPPALPTNAG
jgi:GNAT superfamily N-acetyltransferase